MATRSEMRIGTESKISRRGKKQQKGEGIVGDVAMTALKRALPALLSPIAEGIATKVGEKIGKKIKGGSAGTMQLKRYQGKGRVLAGEGLLSGRGRVLAGEGEKKKPKKGVVFT